MPDRNGLFGADERATLAAIIAQRRDVRGNRFTNEAVSDEALNQIIDAGLHAPSVGFSQPWDFVIVRDRKTREHVRESFVVENDKASALFDDDKADLYRQLKLEGIIEAPVNIAVFYRPTQQPVLGQTSMREAGLFSVVCAVQNMWLMGRALNLGIGWVSILDAERIKVILGAQPAMQLVAYLCVGHVDRFEVRPELERLGWQQRKQRERVVHHERFTHSGPRS